MFQSRYGGKEEDRTLTNGNIDLPAVIAQHVAGAAGTAVPRTSRQKATRGRATIDKDAGASILQNVCGGA